MKIAYLERNWYLTVLFFCISTVSTAQSVYRSNYSFSFGLFYNTALVNFNEQLLNAGNQVINPYASNLSLASDHAFDRFAVQVQADLAIAQNRASVNQTAITLTQSSVSLSAAYNLLKSNYLRLQPGLGVGLASCSMNFEFPDTATSINSIFEGQTSEATIQTKMTLLLTPKLQFYFRLNRSDAADFLIETGYYFSPQQLKWRVEDVSQTRLSGFYFRFGFVFPW